MQTAWFERLDNPGHVPFTSHAFHRLVLLTRHYRGEVLSAVCGNFALVIANPPHLDDPAAADCSCAYEEIDPDLFGEELEQPVCASGDRITAVGPIARNRLGPI